MSLFEIGNPPFGINDCKVATNNLNGTFGSAVDIPSVQMMTVAVQTTSAKLRGDDSDTAVMARLNGAEIQVRHGSISQAALEVMFGVNSTSSGTTPNRYKRLVFIGGTGNPYFAICGKANAAEGAGDVHLFLPKSKNMSGFTVRVEDGAFSIPEYTISAVPDQDYPTLTGMFYEIVEHETAIAVAIPPAY